MNKKLIVMFIVIISIFTALKFIDYVSSPKNQTDIETPGIGIRADLGILDQYLVTPPILSESKKSFLTFNKMGFDTLAQDLNWVAEDFLSFCRPGEYVLDVGAGYGFLTRCALSKGAYVISNDIELKHLLYGRKEVDDHDKLSRLFLNKNPFPYLDIPDNFLGAVILHRVLHFLPGDDIDLGLENVKRWLKKGGKIYIIVMSSEHVSFRQKVLPEFEKRKKNGDPWPGMYLDVPKYLPEQASSLPDKLHIMDQEILRKALERHGFKIEKIDYVSMKKFGVEKGRDGKEAIGAVAIKQN
jgi:SAM-dependent methyltransferase